MAAALSWNRSDPRPGVPATLLNAADRDVQLDSDRYQHGLIYRAVLSRAEDQLALVEEDRLVGRVANLHVVDRAMLVHLRNEGAVLDRLRQAAISQSRLGAEDRKDGE